MSFSGDVKKELFQVINDQRHCHLAELAGMLAFCGEFSINRKGETVVKIRTENELLAKKCFTLIKKSFNMVGSITVRRINNGYTYICVWKGDELLAVKQSDLQRICCKRAYIRGAFLAAGSISDPEKYYHYELVCDREDLALFLRDNMKTFNIMAKIVERKAHYVVYLKEGSQIVDMLNIMEAHIALMNLENVRIMKDMRNSVNRKVNCETANINKVVSAAVRQKEDIRLIVETIGIEKLPENLQEIARVRLEQQEASLKDLGAMLTPPLGKSGVNHRLRKLSEIAKRIRDFREEEKS